MTRGLALAALGLCVAAPAAAQSLVVVEARGIDLKIGSRLDQTRQVKLPAGGKLVVVRSDGRVITLRGPHDGPVQMQAASTNGAARALVALVTTRNDRANRVGAVRSGSNAAPLPSPWLIDVTRSGERCLVEDAPIGWWRPASSNADDFTLLPLDRSWEAALHFDHGQDVLTITNAGDIEVTKAFIIRHGEAEYSIRLHLLPASVSEPPVLAGWMIEKGCIQQADALLAMLPVDDGHGSAE